MRVQKVSKVDDFFELDRFQLVVLAFNECLIYTMLSNVVFNIFGTTQPIIRGCDDVIYNGTSKIAVCAEYIAHSGCKAPAMEYEFHSTAVEFEHLCGLHREHTWLDTVLVPLQITNKLKFSTTCQMVGIIIGSAVAGQLSDLYGRKKVTIYFLTFMLVVSTISSFSPSIDFYIILRFFVGIACGALTTVSTIFVVEFLPSQHRLWLGTVITWAPNYMLFAFIAYLTGSWRWLARIGNLITVAAILIGALLLPESAKFLVQKKRKDEAVKALKYVNKWKKDAWKIDDATIESVVDQAILETGRAGEKAKKYHFIHLYSTKTLALRIIVVSIGMFSLSYVTYGLIFNLDVIKGSVYLNTTFSGFLRWVVGAAAAAIDHFGAKRIGRKRLHFMTMFLVMLCMALTFLIKVTGNGRAMATWVQAFTLIAFGTTGTLFLQFLLVTSELFPTCIRNIANAHVNVCGRIGNVLGPLVFSMAIPIQGAPYLVMTLLCLTDILLFQFCLPETKGVPLSSEMPVRKRKADVLVEEQLITKNVS